MSGAGQHHGAANDPGAKRKSRIHAQPDRRQQRMRKQGRNRQNRQRSRRPQHPVLPSRPARRQVCPQPGPFVLQQTLRLPEQQAHPGPGQPGGKGIGRRAQAQNARTQRQSGENL